MLFPRMFAEVVENVLLMYTKRKKIKVLEGGIGFFYALSGDILYDLSRLSRNYILWICDAFCGIFGILALIHRNFGGFGGVVGD